MTSKRTGAGICLLIMAATLLAYWPAFSAQFVSWDDYKLVRDNAALNPPTWDMALRRFTHPYFELYTPATNLLLQGITLIGNPSRPLSEIKPNAAVFHVSLVLLHVAAIPLLYLLYLTITQDGVAAAFGAGVTALHPLGVEATAWVSSIGLAASVPLIAITLWQWVHFRRAVSPRRRALHYLLAALAYIIALLVKPSNVTLPLMVWAIDGLILKFNWKRSLIAVGPWVIAALPIFLATRNAQSSTLFTFWQPALWQRPAIACDAIAFYCEKNLWPAFLTIDYGRTPALVLHHTWLAVMELLGVVIGLGAVWSYRKRSPNVAVGAAIFLAALLPVLGLASFAFQIYSTVADRYAYPALIGVGWMVAALLTRWNMRGLRVAAVAVLAAWGGLTCLQARMWKDNYSLFTATIARNPQSWMAWNSLGNAMILDGRTAEGLAMSRAAWQIEPDRPRTAIDIGTALAMLHRPAEALPYLQFAALHEPSDSVVAMNLSKVFEQLHDPADAARWRDEAAQRTDKNEAGR